MRTNKMGAMFLVSVLALAGIGITYAGFTDSISVYGTVDTGTVQIDYIGWYSGTWVYKIYDFPETPDSPPGDPAEYNVAGEILIYRGFTDEQPTETDVLDWAADNGGIAELVAYSYADVGTEHGDPAQQYDVDMVYDQIFPCIDFEADFIFHYAGSIPAIINVAQIFPLAGTDEYPEDSGTDFLTWLWNYHIGNPDFGAWVVAYRAQGLDESGYPTSDISQIVSWQFGEPVDVGTQLHFCDYVYVKLVIHLPQDNNLQGLSGTFGGQIGVIQWNDDCPSNPG